MEDKNSNSEDRKDEDITPNGDQLVSILNANIADLRKQLSVEALEKSLIIPLNTIMDEIREELSLFEVDEEDVPDSGDLMSDEDFDKLLECIEVDDGMEEEIEPDSLEWNSNTSVDELLEIESRIIKLIKTKNEPYFHLLSGINKRLEELAAQSDDTIGYDWFD